MDGMAMQRVVNASDTDTVFGKTWMWKKQRLGLLQNVVGQ